MDQHSSTLKVGDAAPDFTLAPANGNRAVTLSGLLTFGPVVIEFLRGTW